MTTQNDVSFYEEGDLFRRVPSQEYHELMACIGTNGGPYGFDDYAIGYFEAARLIWKSIEGGEATVDVAVYPLTFLYRQGIELSVKHLTFFLSSVYSTGEPPKLTHGLSDNWQTVRPLIEQHSVENNYGELQPSQLDGVERVINDFEKMDAGSFVFRYPTSKKGDLFLQDQSRIDLVAMNRVLEAVSHWFVDVMEGVREDLIA